MKHDLRAIAKKDKKRALHLRRKMRVRKIISGTDTRPRLSVFKSSRHLYVQAIDDLSSKTLASVSSLEPALKEKIKDKKKVEIAKIVGTFLAQKLKGQDLTQAVFDRNGFRYIGRVAALADGMREAGLTI